MSETTLTRPGPRTGLNLALHPAQILINLIVTLLAPMFLVAAGGDINYARTAAAETIEAYRAETEADLIVVAKIIAFGLATLGSLALSMSDDIPVPMILKLRGNANSCNRSEDLCRRTLNQGRTEPEAVSAPLPQSETPKPEPQAEPPATPEPDIDQDALLAAATQTSKRAAARLAAMTRQQESANPPDEATYREAAWVASVASVAVESAVELPALSPAERRSMATQINGMLLFANEVLAGNAAPSGTGDAAAILRRGGL